MKKNVLILILSFTCIIILNAQITKDVTPTAFNGSEHAFGFINKTQTNISNREPNNSGVVKFYSYSQIWDTKNITNTKYYITFYNLDYSIYKQIEFNYSTDSIHYPIDSRFFIGFATTNIFNNDNLIEFVVCFQKKINEKTVLYYYLKNENFETIYDFGTEMPTCAFKDENGFQKFSTMKIDENFSRINSIYSINNGIIQKTNQIKSAIQQPYPNPAAQTINLPYQLNTGEQTDMQIYDVNGKLVATKRIDATFDKIVLNVSGYEKGMYVYKYNGKSAKFVVE